MRTTPKPAPATAFINSGVTAGLPQAVSTTVSDLLASDTSRLLPRFQPSFMLATAVFATHSLEPEEPAAPPAAGAAPPALLPAVAKPPAIPDTPPALMPPAAAPAAPPLNDEPPPIGDEPPLPTGSGASPPAAPPTSMAGAPAPCSPVLEDPHPNASTHAAARENRVELRKWLLLTRLIDDLSLLGRASAGRAGSARCDS